MRQKSTLYLRICSGYVEVVEQLSLAQTKRRTREQRRLAYAKLLSAELASATRVVLNPVAVVLRSGCLCTPVSLAKNEYVFGYIDDVVKTKLRRQVKAEHTLERYQEKITVW